MTQIEQAIIKAISSSGLSNYEIANHLNVSRSLVGRWQSTGKISVEKLGVLCELLELDANKLLKNAYLEELELPQLKQEVIQSVRKCRKEDDYLLLAVKKLLS
jgi:transposase